MRLWCLSNKIDHALDIKDVKCRLPTTAPRRSLKETSVKFDKLNVCFAPYEPQLFLRVGGNSRALEAAWIDLWEPQWSKRRNLI